MNTLNKVRTWTEEQTLIFAWFAMTKFQEWQHLVIGALPGTGKTSTSIEAICSHVKGNIQIVYLAFMSRNALDAKSKINDPRCLVVTCNAIGNQILNKFYKFVRIDNDFTPWTEHNRAAKICPDLKKERAVQRLVAQLVSAAKNSIIGVPTVAELEKLACERVIIPSDKQCNAGYDLTKIATIARQVMELSLTDNWRSFDDQIWQPLTLNLVRGEFDLVILDEMQDFNRLNYEFAKRLVKPNGRICGVGDNNQSMYTFRGAVPNGMDKFAVEIGAGLLKLTETFRVPKTGVAGISHMLPDYKANENNPEGIYIPAMPVEVMTSEAKTGCAILSRTNAPLMPFGLDFLRKGKAARIEGKDIGRDLANIIDQVGETNIDKFVDALGIWEQVRINKAGTGFNSTRVIDLVMDQAATLRVLCEACNSTDEMKAKIKSLFQDSKDNPLPAIVLSTVHKAKGLEWETVYVLQSTFEDSRKPTNEIEQAEEDHIKIVAATRHWNKLAYVVGKAGNKASANNPPIADDDENENELD